MEMTLEACHALILTLIQAAFHAPKAVQSAQQAASIPTKSAATATVQAAIWVKTVTAALKTA